MSLRSDLQQGVMVAFGIGCLVTSAHAQTRSQWMRLRLDPGMTRSIQRAFSPRLFVSDPAPGRSGMCYESETTTVADEMRGESADRVLVIADLDRLDRVMAHADLSRIVIDANPVTVDTLTADGRIEAAAPVATNPSQGGPGLRARLDTIAESGLDPDGVAALVIYAGSNPGDGMGSREFRLAAGAMRLTFGNLNSELTLGVGAAISDRFNFEQILSNPFTIAQALLPGWVASERISVSLVDLPVGTLSGFARAQVEQMDGGPSPVFVGWLGLSIDPSHGAHHH